MGASWDSLFRRAIRGDVRPKAEEDSVPIPDRWGMLSQEEWAAQAFLLPHLERSSRWLDLGCGTGSVLAGFLSRYPHASGLGLELSEAAVSYGNAHRRKRRLGGRMHLETFDFRAPALISDHFDCVFALFSLQCLSLKEFYDLVRWLDTVLAVPGVFAGAARSTSRSIPASYVALPDEPGSYISGEPHECGMVYHHYSRAEIMKAAELLRGSVAHIEEFTSYRSYDPSPNRAWWSFVIERSAE